MKSAGPIAAALGLLVVVAVRAADPTRDPAAGASIAAYLRDPPLTLIEACLAAVALGVLVRRLMILVLLRRSRPVDVSPLVVDEQRPQQPGAQPAGGATAGEAGRSAQPPAATSWPPLVKATLHDLGALPEPSVPLGAIQPTSLSFVDLELPAQANLVAGILRFALDRFALQTPYRVTTTVLHLADDADPLYRFSLELLDAQTRQLADHHVVSAESYEEAAKRAACLVYQDVTSRGPTPPWELWNERDGASLRNFLAGLEAEKDGRHVEALSRYAEAARAEPGNAVIHLRLGNLQERQELFQQAFETYCETVLTWPEIVQARHRLALTLVAIAMKDDVDVSPRTMRLLGLLKASDGEGAGAEEGEGAVDVRDELLREAQRQWQRLRDELRWDRSLFTGLARAARRDWQTRQGIPRGPMRRNARVAGLGISVYRLQRREVTGTDDDAAGQLEELERQVRRMVSASPVRRLARSLLRNGPDYRAHYNCACIYGVLLKSAGDVPEYVDRAIEQLREVMRSGETDRVLGWALDDPDLVQLWKVVEDESPPAGVSEEQLLALDLLRHQLAARPTVRRISPEGAGPGETVSVRGINFQTTPDAEVVVWFGDVSAQTMGLAVDGFDTDVEVVVPNGLAPGEVELAVAVGDRKSTTKPFNVTSEGS